MKPDEYFVVLFCQNGRATVMVDDNRELALFSSKDDARLSADNNILGINFGYEIHEVGAGE